MFGPGTRWLFRRGHCNLFPPLHSKLGVTCCSRCDCRSFSALCGVGIRVTSRPHAKISRDRSHPNAIAHLCVRFAAITKTVLAYLASKLTSWVEIAYLLSPHHYLHLISPACSHPNHGYNLLCLGPRRRYSFHCRQILVTVICDSRKFLAHINIYCLIDLLDAPAYSLRISQRIFRSINRHKAQIIFLIHQQNPFFTHQTSTARAIQSGQINQI